MSCNYSKSCDKQYINTILKDAYRIICIQRGNWEVPVINIFRKYFQRKFIFFDESHIIVDETIIDLINYSCF